MSIQSFQCKDTQAVFDGGQVARFANILVAAQRKLQQLDCASTLEFFRSPPGNRLELLRGDRNGLYSIRINSQFRIIFFWTSAGPERVQILDHH